MSDVRRDDHLRTGDNGSSDDVAIFTVIRRGVNQLFVPRDKELWERRTQRINLTPCWETSPNPALIGHSIIQAAVSWQVHLRPSELRRR